MLFLVFLSVGMLTWTAQVYISKLNSGKEGLIFPFLAFASMFLVMLIVGFTCLKNITISDQHIEYSYTLFPFRKIRIAKQNLDGFATVMEKRNTVVGVSDVPVPISFSDKEAVWLFSSGRVCLRIPSMFYENYDELKKGVQDVSALDAQADNSLVQLLYLTRLKKIKTNPNKS